MNVITLPHPNDLKGPVFVGRVCVPPVNDSAENATRWRHFQLVFKLEVNSAGEFVYRVEQQDLPTGVSARRMAHPRFRSWDV